MATDARNHTVPAAADAPARSALTNMSLSIRDIVYVASTAARGSVVSAMAAAGRTISATEPLYVHRGDAGAGRELEYSVDGSTFKTVATSGLQGAYSMAAGSVSVSISGSATGSAAITFPASRFSVAPLVVATVNDASGYVASIASITTSGATITLRHVDNTTATLSRTVAWYAIQMTSGAAAG